MSFAVAQYQASRIETSSPVQIVVTLYDGALRFLRTGINALQVGDIAGKGIALTKAHAIITELLVTLNHEAAPEISGQLEAIYSFVLDRILRANAECDEKLIDEAIRALLPLRDAWAQLARTGHP